MALLCLTLVSLPPTACPCPKGVWLPARPLPLVNAWDLSMLVSKLLSLPVLQYQARGGWAWQT